MQAASLTYQAEVEVETESDTDSLPDWPINPGEYEPVLLTTENTLLLSPQKTWASIRTVAKAEFLCTFMMDLLKILIIQIESVSINAVR